MNQLKTHSINISKNDFIFRRCKDRAIFWNYSYEKSHVPLFVQPLATIVQLSVQVFVFSACSGHLSAA